MMWVTAGRESTENRNREHQPAGTASRVTGLAPGALTCQSLPGPAISHCGNGTYGSLVPVGLLNP
jgi:hypothetical protein